ncbi:amino acid adenylation domain-containing protein [Streptomyces sp. NPDC001678]|uniref:amino acid adenylation domain-containing protein n=1 Tax=Streptomyces sp. NPDC001678 TaxID=3364599 RepID=UPI0036882E98
MSTAGRFDLSPQRRALLESLLRAEGIERSPSRTVVPREDPAAPVPLAFSQSRFWFLDRFSANNASYVISAALRMRGDFRPELFTRACQEVVRRHEALRTVFSEAGGQPVQQVRDDLPPGIRTVDLRDLPPREVPAEIERREAELVATPFDLATGPLLRAEILDLAGDEAVVLVNIHHIAADRWSMDVLMRELTTVYGALAEGRAPELPPLAVQYPDFAMWQNDARAQAAWEEDLAYWTRQLAGIPSETGLPTTFPRPREKTYRGSSVPLRLSPELLGRLQDLARSEGATVFMALTAAFKTMVSRLSGTEDVVVGTPVANRTLVELEPLVGLFVNTLVLRTDLGGDPSFREVLRRVAKVCLDAYDHQNVPFERLVEQLQPERSLAHTPVFQVLVSYQNVPVPTWDVGPVRAEPVPLEARKAEFDLLLDMFEDNGSVWGRLEYSTDLFDEAAARRLAELFERILRAVTDDPDRPVGRIPLLGTAGHPRPAPGAATAAPERPEPGPVHRLFEERARRTPRAEAVRHRGGTLTYEELDRRANRLAHRLRRLGVRPGVLAAIALERSPELVVAALAVLKAGGALVPVDPADPRLARLLDDARAPLLLTRRRVLDATPPVDAEALCLDELGTALEGEPEHAPEDVADADDLACVGFTSGTSGAPRGVTATHRAVHERLLRLGDTHGLAADDRVLHASPFSADALVSEVLWPLTAGATLVLAAPAGHRDPELLAETIHDEGVTTVQFTPSVLDLFLSRPGAARCAGLRRVLCGGEPLPPSLAERFAARSRARLHHVYGSCETGPAAVTWTCPEDAPGERVPIGLPAPGVRAHVLDRYREPVPTGVPGELYLGGAGLADGYLDRPDLTDEHFLEDPFAPGERLHRTGDLARVRDDGTLELLGRAGDRPTVRGFHADPARAEAELARLDGVRRAVVAPRADGSGRIGLVAHVTPDGDRTPAPDALTARLAERLPDYLVPSAVVVLPELPLTAAGRTDHDALPGAGPADGGPEPTAPRNDLERSVAEAWQDLLGVERVGVHDDFFDLGGHSLLMTRLASRLSAAHGVPVPLRDLFDNPTVARMAARIAERKTGGAPAVTAVPVADRTGGVPLSFAQEELYVHQPVDAEDPFHNVLTALRLRGPLDEAALRGALDDIVRRHEALRTRVVVRPGAAVQETEATGTWPLAVVDLRPMDEATRTAELRRIVEAEEHRPFRIAEETLVRATLVRLADDEHALIQVMHHLITDNWSYGVLFEEMGAHYGARVRGTGGPGLPPLEAQFADIAAWQRQRLDDGTLDEDLDHWRKLLADPPPTLRFTAPEHQAVPPATGATSGFTLDAGTADALAGLGGSEGATLFMVLLAAFDVLLSAYSGGDDIPVDFPVAGRERPETEHLIGYFVNHLVVRADLSGPLTFRDLLGQVRERTLSAYAHQEAPLWALDGVVTEDHDPSAVSFNLLNATVPSLDLHGLTAEPLDLGLGDDYVFQEVVVDFEASAVDLALIVRQDDTGTLRGMWLYALDRLDARAVAAMTRQWPRLLAAVTDDPDRPVEDLKRLLLGPLPHQGRG